MKLLGILDFFKEPLGGDQPTIADDDMGEIPGGGFAALDRAIEAGETAKRDAYAELRKFFASRRTSATYASVVKNTILEALDDLLAHIGTASGAAAESRLVGLGIVDVYCQIPPDHATNEYFGRVVERTRQSLGLATLRLARGTKSVVGKIV